MNDEYLSKVVILIPSLDPDEQMTRQIIALTKKGFQHIVVVDDGSRLDTQKYFEEIKQYEGVTVLRHAVNQGKGRALKTGMHYFLNTYTEEQVKGLVTADADGQHGIDDVTKVAKALVERGNLVLGTRAFSNGNVPFKSRSGNRITTNVFALLYGKKIHDTQTGLRGIPYSFMENCLKMTGERFEYETVMLIEAVKQHLPIEEVPIETIYIDSNRATHFHALKDSLKIYRVILGTFLRFSMSGIASFLIDIGLFAFSTKILFASLDMTVNVFLGTALARVLSSLFNYTLNRAVVFGETEKGNSFLGKYYVLCVAQALLSWAIVVLVFNRLNIDTTLIKCVVDCLLFFMSYQIQRVWVFRRTQKC